MKKRVIAALLAMVLVLGMTACSSSSSDDTSDDDDAEEVTEAVEEEEDDTSSSADLSGSISLSGSTSMEDVVTALAETFMEMYPNVTVNAEYVGSGAGIEAVTAGTVDIGNASRNLKDEELANGVVENIIAIDGIAVIVDSSNTVTELSTEDIIAIFTGEITNWSELGGSDTPIVVVGRESGSGTRSAFEELLDIEDVCAYASELDSTGAVLAKVASTEGAIGYISLDKLSDEVIAVSIDGVEATEENIVAGDYILSRPFVMATLGEISEQSELVQAWFEFVYGDEGAAVIEAVGLIVP